MCWTVVQGSLVGFKRTGGLGYCDGYNLYRQTKTDHKVADHEAGTTDLVPLRSLFVNHENYILNLELSGKLLRLYR